MSFLLFQKYRKEKEWNQERIKMNYRINKEVTLVNLTVQDYRSATGIGGLCDRRGLLFI